MTFQATRIMKEARAVFLPWCVVCLAGLLPLIHLTRWTEGFTVFGFFFGMPILATLSFGNEFQYGTLPLLLSQPVDRMVIWREKMGITVVAVLSASVFFLIGWRMGAIHLEPPHVALAAVAVIASISSANYWTLTARSTIGGFALYGIGCALIYQIPWAVFQVWNREYRHFPPAEAMRIIYVAGAFVTLCYAVLMLWLGSKKLAGFQMAGGAIGGELLMSGPNLAPKYLVQWFRCRPTGAILNLIRKEFRLLRPLWLIMLLVVPIWICAAILAQFLPEDRLSGLSSTEVLAIAFVTTCPVLAILAGALSLGEERTSGTHMWHMTLPVSTGYQWFIKITMALSTAFVCAALLPMLVLTASGLTTIEKIPWMLWAFLAGLVSFWCACVAHGTVRAAVWVGPVLFALGLVVEFSDWSVGKVSSFSGALMEMMTARSDTAIKITNVVSNFDVHFNPTKLVYLAILGCVPTVLFMLAQTKKLYRAQLREGPFSVLRPLASVATMAFLNAFVLFYLVLIIDQAKQNMWSMFREAHEAIVVAQPNMEKQDVAHPLQFTGEDLAKAAPLSEQTRRWLRNSNILVIPETYGKKNQILSRYCCGGNSRGFTVISAGKQFMWYSAIIHLENGSECILSFQSNQIVRSTSYYGILGGKCE